MVGLGFSPLRGFERRVWSVTCCFSLVSVFSFYVAFIGDEGFIFVFVLFSPCLSFVCYCFGFTIKVDRFMP